MRRILQQRIAELWSDVDGLRVLGHGYPAPYLRQFMGSAERVIGVMPAARGVHNWPVDGKNLIALAEENALPLETESIDRVLMVHSLEYTEAMGEDLREIWRVLKGNGRLLIIVPNRAGMWSHADWSPLGQGTPYSMSQICHYLKENRFVLERTDEALFMPPYKSSFLMKSAGTFEYLGRSILPFVAGVHMVEASKQIYARSTPGGGSKIAVKDRGFLGGRPAVEPDAV